MKAMNGDLLTQDRNNGGLGIGTAWTSAVFLLLIVSLVAVAQRRSAGEAA